MFCVDDEHSGREPKRGWRLYLTLLLSVYSRYQDNRFLSWQHLGQVRVSLLADQDTSLVYGYNVDLYNFADGFEPLHRSHLPDLLQERTNFAVLWLCYWFVKSMYITRFEMGQIQK